MTKLKTLSQTTISQIVFEEVVVDDISKTQTMYFIAPREILADKYKKDSAIENAEISLAFPLAAETNTERAAESYLMFSPTKEVDGVITDYDWYEVYLDLDTILRLINKADNHNQNNIKGGF